MAAVAVNEGHFRREGGRDVVFGTLGEEDGHAALTFYPLGSSRQALVLVEEAANKAKLRLLCTNRPGNGSTSPPLDPPEGVSAIAWHLETAVDDARALLAKLQIAKVSILFFCAGTPFALRFASKYPELCTGRMLGVAPWVSPADCQETKGFFRWASSLPACVVSSVGGPWMAAGSYVTKSLPSTSLARAGLEKEEAVIFDREAVKMAARFRVATSESGSGDALDLPVLLASYKDIGLSPALSSEQAVQIFFGEKDTMVTPACVRWLGDVLSGPSRVTLQELPQTSHTGALLLLDERLWQALAWLDYSTRFWSRARPGDTSFSDLLPKRVGVAAGLLLTVWLGQPYVLEGSITTAALNSKKCFLVLACANVLTRNKTISSSVMIPRAWQLLAILNGTLALAPPPEPEPAEKELRSMPTKLAGHNMGQQFRLSVATYCAPDGRTCAKEIGESKGDADSTPMVGLSPWLGEGPNAKSVLDTADFDAEERAEKKTRIKAEPEDQEDRKEDEESKPVKAEEGTETATEAAEAGPCRAQPDPA
ncbi:Wdr33 [Symbiodinium sp. KB8]|nr:Wdr33 [Symbiodinium sp. KB8]